MANKKLTNNDLLLLLEKQESILKDILDFSQLQLAETDPVGLDRIMKNKEICFEELERIVSLIEKWHLEFDRSLTKNEQNKDFRFNFRPGWNSFFVTESFMIH